MRRLIWIVLFFAILWCAWWAVFGWGLKSALDTWFEDRRTAGWQADYATLELRGFPARVQADMTDIVLADTVSGLVMNLSDLTIGAPTHWPGDVTLTLPSDPISFVSPQGRSTLQILDAIADLRLHPGPSLELERISAVAGEWSLLSGTQSVLSARDLTLTMDQSDTFPSTYTFIVQAADLSPGEIPRAALRLPPDWPVTFETFTLNGDITFDKPWDISALEKARPQPRMINLALAETAWSDLRLFFVAELIIDEAGTPTGTINIQAENWQVMLDLAERSGALPSALRQQAESGLSTLARFSGDPSALDVQMNLRGGLMFVGFIPIGPAPKIVLR
jgi:hypothetical protein